VNEDDCKTLFEEKYDEIMSDEQTRRAFAFYNELKEANNASPVLLAIYTECSSTLDPQHNKATFMKWVPFR